ncbi:MAG: winged helix-turn-helix transcriptional regulator [Prolixibacteraceae bacterium]|jgi:DNA-binding transcriptional ArsR family regulator|nr:winged helix-turn-helix transcriptional regulator [Prolixibacteraceae bacterium]
MLQTDFNDNTLRVATAMLKAMAHPIRLSILHLLKDGNKLTVTQIHETIGIEQSTASHHLGILRDKGVLCSKRDGKNTLYYIKHKVLGQILDCMNTCACEE